LEDESPVLTFTVENEFHIPNLEKLIVNNKFIEKDFLEYLADLSLSQTRGLQASIINGTPLFRLFIPIADLSQVRNDTIKYSEIG
jgi:hypothetical protein